MELSVRNSCANQGRVANFGQPLPSQKTREIQELPFRRFRIRGLKHAEEKQTAFKGGCNGFEARPVAVCHRPCLGFDHCLAQGGGHSLDPFP